MKVLFAAIMLLILPVAAHAEAEGLQRKKVLKFDGRQVEAMNKRPLDSFSQISDAEKQRAQRHLYKKKTHFDAETSETLKQMRYNP